MTPSVSAKPQRQQQSLPMSKSSSGLREESPTTVTSSTPSFVHKYKNAQRDRTLFHPRIHQQPSREAKEEATADETTATTTTKIVSVPPIPVAKHSFVVCADPQLGMTSSNQEWQTELEYSRAAVEYINNIQPRPLFCCICGDLVDMGSGSHSEKRQGFTPPEMSDIQRRQRLDFQDVWSYLHPDIAVVCVCGNHDVGNHPTRESIDSFRKIFGDDYLSFWSTPSSFNIVLNSSLFSDQTGDGAMELYEKQFAWLQNQLEDATSGPNECNTIFVFGHHPWFLYDEKEEASTMTGGSPYNGTMAPDSYFHIPKPVRIKVLELFRKYNVTAAFAGHFHQNLTSKASFGMDMIITSSLSVVLKSTANNTTTEPNTRGLRIVEVDNTKKGAFHHRFVSLP